MPEKSTIMHVGPNPCPDMDYCNDCDTVVHEEVQLLALSAHYQWEDETVWERTGHPPSYAEAKKMKSITLNTHGCATARLRDWYSSSSASELSQNEII